METKLFAQAVAVEYFRVADAIDTELLNTRVRGTDGVQKPCTVDEILHGYKSWSPVRYRYLPVQIASVVNVFSAFR